MANVRKRILQLTALESASLNTSLVGVDDGTTYRIELDTLADAVTARVNILDRDRLSSLESVTSSFETKGRSVISSSAQITAFGFISTSVDITALNSFTSSQNATNTAFTNGINSRLQTSSFNDFSASVHTEILAATNEQDLSYLVTTSSFNTYTASISTGSLVDRLSSLENNTGSYLTSLNGTISSSAQITSFGFISESVDISLLNSFTSSQSTLNTAFTNGINARLQTSSFNDFSTSVDSRIIAATNEQSLTHLVTTSSFNQYTASQSTSSLVDRLNQIESVSGSWITESETGSFATTGSNVFKEQQIISGAFTVSISGNAFGVNENPTPNNIFWSYIPNDTNTTSIESGWVVNIETVGTYTVTDVEYDYPFVKITLSDALLQLPYRCNGYFSLPSRELKFGTDGVLKISGSLSVSGSITGSTNFNTIVNKPTLISGSSQLTSSFDTRYALSGSFVSSSNVSSIQTITSASYAAITPVSGTLYIIIG